MNTDTSAGRTLLGYLLIRPEVLDEVELNSADFSDPRHRHVFNAMLAANVDGQVDLLTVKDRLEEAGVLEDVGGPAYVASLVDDLPVVLTHEHVMGLALIFKRFSSRENRRGGY